MNTNMAEDSLAYQFLSAEDYKILDGLIGDRHQSLIAVRAKLYITDFETEPRKKEGFLSIVVNLKNEATTFQMYSLETNLFLWSKNTPEKPEEYVVLEDDLHLFKPEISLFHFKFENNEEGKAFENVIRRLDSNRRSLDKAATKENLELKSNKKSISKFSKSESDLTAINSSTEEKPKRAKGFLKPKLDKESRKEKKNLKKIKKEGIGQPFDFRHVSHIGWDASEAFGEALLDPQLKQFLARAGVSDIQLRDPETREFIYDFIEAHGGLASVKDDVFAPPRAPPVPSRAPPPQSVAVKPSPPPPPPNVSNAQNRHVPPPASHQRTAPPPPPPPPMSSLPKPADVDTSRNVPTPPPEIIDARSDQHRQLNIAAAKPRRKAPPYLQNLKTKIADSPRFKQAPSSPPLSAPRRQDSQESSLVKIDLADENLETEKFNSLSGNSIRRPETVYYSSLPREKKETFAERMSLNTQATGKPRIIRPAPPLPTAAIKTLELLPPTKVSKQLDNVSSKSSEQQESTSTVSKASEGETTTTDLVTKASEPALVTFTEKALEPLKTTASEEASDPTNKEVDAENMLIKSDSQPSLLREEKEELSSLKLEVSASPRPVPVPAPRKKSSQPP